jgi:3-oxoacyl-[acyl-carrier protein] reductase
MTPRTVLITGAGRGIGRAIAELYRSSGYAVLAPARAELDLASHDSITAYFAGPSHSQVDVLVNNAGENPIAEIGSISPQVFSRSITVNLAAPLRLIQAVAPHMTAAGWGRIVNISSCYSMVSRPGRAAYGAAKAGLNSLTRTASLEYAAHGILVNGVAPGFVETDLTHKNNSPEQIRDLCSRIPLGRLARPEEIASLVFFLGSQANTYITGQCFVMDGGFLCQ